MVESGKVLNIIYQCQEMKTCGLYQMLRENTEYEMGKDREKTFFEES